MDQEPHPSGEVPPVDPQGEQAPTEATPPVGTSGAFSWTRGMEPGEQPVNAVMSGPPVTPAVSNGFRDERPASTARLVGVNARSVRVPAILFGIGVLAYIVTFIITFAGLLQAGTSSYKVRTDWTTAECRQERGEVSAAVAAYETTRNRVPTSTGQLLDAGLIDHIPTAYRLTPSGDVVARAPGPCSLNKNSEGDAIPAATTSGVQVWGVLASAPQFLLMWWLYRAFRSLPPGRRHFSPMWALSPLLLAAAAVGMRFFLQSIATYGSTGTSIDNFGLAVTLLGCALAVWYLYGAIVRRYGTMFEVMGEHFAQMSWFGTIIRWYGAVVLALVPVGALCFLISRSDTDVARGIVVALMLVYAALLVLLQLATIVSVLCGVVVITLGQERAMKEHSQLMTEERLDHISRQRALSDAMAGARSGPAAFMSGG